MDDIIQRNMNALQNIDFGDIHKDERKQNEYHVHCNQLGRKYVTIIVGVEQFNCDLKKLCSKLRAHFSCSCALKNVKDKDGESGKVFKLSGDHRKDIRSYLLQNKVIDEDDIFIIHG